MIDTKQFISAINQIADEKGIPKEKVIETIEIAIAAAYKKDYGKKSQMIKAKLDPTTGQMDMFQVKTVVDESMIKSEEEIAQEELEREQRKTELQTNESASVRQPADYGDARESEIENGVIKKVRFNEDRHIMLDDARKIKEDVQVLDEMVFPLEAHSDFGRIAAQTAKQVIIQRLRDVERDVVFGEFKAKEGELVNAQVQRFEGRNIVMDLGKTSGILYPEDQIAKENYRAGSRIKVYIVRVESTSRGPVIVVSRSHPKMIAKLFELEIPEIASGTVEIKALAREAGARSKVAVVANQEGVDPIGSCVGQRGTRIDTIISELSGEKIDIIEWSADSSEFISSALSPAKVVDITVNEETKEATVIVPDNQLSLAIGKGGQNVRLAAKLTGWKIDVKSAGGGEESPKEEIIEAMAELDQEAK